MISTILDLLNEYKERNNLTGKVNIDEFLSYIEETIESSDMLYHYFDWRK